MTKSLVSILVPNYKTPELTKLCLRLLRKYTDLHTAKIIVIDNDSADESLAYLKQLSWIHLIERPRILNEPPVLSHARALDLGLTQVNTPYVLSIHTDTLVKHPQWLNFLITHIQKGPSIAGVGSWKLESKPWYKRLLKYCERSVQKTYQHLVSNAKVSVENYRYLRSHCALYRMDFINRYQLTFADGQQVAGKLMHKKLIELGYEMLFLPSESLGQYLDHINHATTLLNAEFKNSIRRNRNQALAHLEKRLHRVDYHDILMSDHLDRE